jgi:hypothetical protein
VAQSQAFNIFNAFQQQQQQLLQLQVALLSQSNPVFRFQRVEQMSTLFDLAEAESVHIFPS